MYRSGSVGTMGGMDAVLLVSFGGPESVPEVMPFLHRVTGGRDVPAERLRQVAEHYLARGGVSPINAQNRRLRAALADTLAPDGLAVYWGNRNSAPWLADALGQMSADGVTRAIAVLTSAYSSYSGCRQYREDLAGAMPDAVDLEMVKIPPYYNAPGFVRASLAHLHAGLEAAQPDAHVLFTTHSLPVAMARVAGIGGGQYVAQHRELAGHLIDQVAVRNGHTHPWDLVFQSRSGPPQVPWLEPDVNDHLTRLAERGVREVVVVPIGFVSDHMEVVQDLDTEAAATAASLGIRFLRAKTVSEHPAFVAGIADWVRDVRAGRTPEVAFGRPLPTRCPVGCCPNPRSPKPALCEEAL